jgi:membrane protease YdiL (CAAX protease family)
MDHAYSSKPLIRSGWMRVLLYIISFGVIVGAAVLGYIAFMAKSQSHTADLLNFNSGVVILLLLVISLLLTYGFVRWVDRRSFLSLGLSVRGRGREAIAGGALAIFIVCASTVLLKVTDHLRWMDILFDPKALFIAFGSVLLAAFYEELVFRGYILSNLMESFPKWMALTISALLFMLFHWTAIGFFPLVNHLILGFILGLNFIYTRNLWFSICFHVGWKFFEGPVLGFSADESFQTLLQTELTGDEKITGGGSGLEGSVILTAVSLLSLLALYLIYQRKLNPQYRPAPGRI